MSRNHIISLRLGLLFVLALYILIPLGSVQAKQLGSIGSKVSLPRSVYPQAQQLQTYGPPAWPFAIIHDGSSEWLDPSPFDYKGVHYAVDIDLHANDPVYSVCNGNVIFWGNWHGWINTIWIDCGNNDYFGYSHLYKDKPHANTGESVLGGQQIAVVGPIKESGNGDRDHLHFMKMHQDPLSVDITTLPWVDPMPGITVSISPADLLAQNQHGAQSQSQTQTVLFQKTYDMKSNYGGYENYQRNMLMFYWGVSPGSKYTNAYLQVPFDFSGYYTFKQGTYWLNGVFGTYGVESGMGESEVGQIRQGGGACDAISFVAEALANAGFTVPKASYLDHGYHIHTKYVVPGVNPLYSIGVSATGSPNYTSENGQDVKVINPYAEATLSWKVEGGRYLTLTVTGNGTPAYVESGGAPIANVQVPQIVTQPPSVVSQIVENVSETIIQRNVISGSVTEPTIEPVLTPIVSLSFLIGVVLLGLVGLGGVFVSYARNNPTSMGVSKVALLFTVCGFVFLFVTNPQLNFKNRLMGIPISIKVGNVNISNANAHEPQPTATETEEVLASPAEERQAEDMVNVTFDLPNSTPSPSGPQPEGCSIDSSWPAAIQQWCGFLTAYAPNLAGYSADWGAAQMFQESHGNPNALSSTCASGLIQVMPSDGKGFIKYRADGSSYFVCDLVNGTTENYVKFYNGQFRNRPTIAQLRDPGFNVKYAMSYMTGLLKSHNDIQKSLVYYGGIAYGDTYKNAVTAHYNCYVQKLSTSCK